MLIYGLEILGLNVVSVKIVEGDLEILGLNVVRVKIVEDALESVGREYMYGES